MPVEAAALRAEIIDLTYDGRGVADLDGRRVFVPDALPGELVEIALGKRRRKLQEADLVRVLEPSPERVVPPCEYFGRCGGCVLQHLDDAAQVRFKQEVVAQAFSRIGRVEPREWLAPITGPTWRYRRRARLGVKFVQGKDRVLVGFRERAAPYITDMAHCPVLMPPLDNLLGELASSVGRSSVRQRLPQIETAVGDAASAIVLRVLDAPSSADEALFAEFGQRHGIDVYLQPGGPGTVVPLGGPPRTLDYSLQEFGITLRFAPTDFVQVNAPVNAQMVAAAVELAAVQKRRPHPRSVLRPRQLQPAVRPARGDASRRRRGRRLGRPRRAQCRAQWSRQRDASWRPISQSPTGASSASIGTSSCSIRRGPARRSQSRNLGTSRPGSSSMCPVIRRRSRATQACSSTTWAIA